MIRKGWYMVAYDIADQKRLAKIHYRFKKEGVHAQKSVFLVCGTEAQVERLLDRIAKFMNPKEDDLRAYPIAHPAKVWTNGPNPLTDLPAAHFEEKREPPVRTKRKPGNQGWLKRLLRRGA